MKKNVVVWKKSVYKNDFVCPDCGRKLFDEHKDKLNEDNTTYMDKDHQPVLCRHCLVLCRHCRKPVAFILYDVEMDDNFKERWPYESKLN